MHPVLFLTGFVTVSVPSAAAGAFFEMCRACGYAFRSVKNTENGTLYATFSALTARRVLRSSALRNLPVTPCVQGGAPTLLRRFLHRPGLVAGTVLAVGILLLSSLFLWDVDVTGVETVPEAELRAELAAVGLSPGAFLPRLDADALAVAVRRADPRLSYVAVNLHGTVAAVQVRESVETPPRETPRPANLVAKCDGVVVLPLIFEGERLVEAGDTVRAGDILAGGVIDTDNNGLRVTRAAGEVLARTVHTYTVRVPFTYEQKAYTGRRGYEMAFRFFGWEGNFLKTTGKLTGEYDIIDFESKWSGALPRAVPVFLTGKTAWEYTAVPARRTAKEALETANAELTALLAADSATRTLLEKTVEVAADEAGVTLICTITAEENIAVVSEIAVP